MSLTTGGLTTTTANNIVPFAGQLREAVINGVDRPAFPAAANNIAPFLRQGGLTAVAAKQR